MIENLEDFVTEYKKVQKEGWIKTIRSGPTGIGATLEKKLGIIENNKDEPDFGEYELKAGRIESNSNLTLFTRNPLPRGSISRLCDKLGYYGEECEYKKIMHITLKSQDWIPIANTGHNLKIIYENEKLQFVSDLGVEEAYYTKSRLEKDFNKKYRNKLVYAKAESRLIDGHEEFWFKDAFIIEGFDFSKIYDLLNSGSIEIDIRIGLNYDEKKKKFVRHDHGTAFRISTSHQDELFLNKRKIA